MAEKAILGHQRNGTVLSFDGINAFNFIKKSRMPPAPAKDVAPVESYASNLYARTPPKLTHRGRTGIQPEPFPLEH